MRRAAAGAAVLMAAVGVPLAGTGPARAACAPAALAAPKHEARVVAVRDSRTVQLNDGRELLLAGIEPVGLADPAATAALAELAAGRRLVFAAAGTAMSADRYGRFPVWAWEEGAAEPLQARLVAAGFALAAGRPAGEATADCAHLLLEAEKNARAAQLGLWRGGFAIKSAESPGGIVPLAGRFAIVEGRVRSVREAGATVYVNFGRRWLTGFAVPISRRTMGILESAGLRPRTWEGRRIRVRGWVELRGGPRIAVTRPGQLEVLTEE